MRLRTPENQNGQALPIFRLRCDQGGRLAVPTGGSATGALPSGTYLLNPTTNMYISIGVGVSAGLQAGSFLLAAGAGAYFRLNAGERIACRPVQDAGSLFYIPVEGTN